MAKGFIATKGAGTGEDLSVGSEAWNIANSYVKAKILRQLILLDMYEDIAQYGVVEMEEERMYSANDIAKRRKDGLMRFISTLKQLLGNVRFALRKGDVQGINEFFERIKNVEQYLEGITTTKENMITREIEIKINEEHFNTCFGVLQNIKDEINFPINKAGLIFKSSEEVDLDKLMMDIVEGG